MALLPADEKLHPMLATLGLPVFGRAQVDVPGASPEGPCPLRVAVALC